MCFTAVSFIDKLKNLIAGSFEQYLCIEHNAYVDLTPVLVAQAAKWQGAKNTVIICADTAAVERFKCLAKELSFEFNEDQSSDLSDLSPIRTDPSYLPQIYTVQEFCAWILQCLNVEDLFGRKIRLLSENEYDILIEDMKVSGLKAHRIKEILKFFQKSISENAHLQEGFLLTAEERLLYKMLQENLNARSAMLTSELPALALQAFLQKPETFADEFNIIATDYGTYSLAAQQLIEHLAPNRLMVSGTAKPCINVEEPYPYTDGFVNFTARHPQTKSIKLDTPLPDVANETVAFESAEDEIAGIADKVAALISGGAVPASIAIAVPNELWGQRIVELLTSKDIACARVKADTKIKGDVRNVEKSGRIKFDAFTKLLVDKSDMVALRTWIGVGDWLAASDAFAELMAYAAKNAKSVELAIKDLRATATSDRALKLFDKVEKAMDELDELMESLPKLDHDETTALLDEHGMTVVLEVIDGIKTMPLFAGTANTCGQESAATASTCEQELSAAKSPEFADAVLIVPYSCCHGLHKSTVFITGLVGGFLPALDALSDDFSAEHRNTMMTRAQHLFDDLQTMATDKLICSYFTSESLELATKLKLHTTRIYVKNGQRRARVAACPFVEQVTKKQLSAQVSR